MIRHTAPLLLFSLALVGIAACVPSLFTGPAVVNANASAVLFPLGFFVPAGGTGFNNPFFFPNTVTTATGTVVATDFTGFTQNANFNRGSPNGLNENGIFNLNFGDTFNLNFTGVFNMNNAGPPPVSQATPAP